MRFKIIFAVLFINLIFLSSCKQSADSRNSFESSVKEEQPLKSKYPTTHPYGAYSCPDNLRGFPPLDVTEMNNFMFVNGRLPTKEEISKGESLMYFDTAKLSSVRPFFIGLPKLARYYSEYTKKNELVIVFQAVIAENDTVVGFRYLNGGNGSAYYGEVSFVSDEEREKLGKTPFVHEIQKLKASKQKIWEVITEPKYAKILGAVFDKGAFVESEWKKDANVYFKYEPDILVSTGIITAFWENMYIQIDYNFDGYHYCEKFLILENMKTGLTEFHVAAGPYGEDIDAQKLVWSSWLKKVDELCQSDLDSFNIF